MADVRGGRGGRGTFVAGLIPDSGFPELFGNVHVHLKLLPTSLGAGAGVTALRVLAWIDARVIPVHELVM